MRIGIGYDIHPLVEGRKLFLGGIQVPFHMGLMGHSDGDVLIHAISDAILGSISEEDIGFYFPEKDPSCEGIKGEEILKRVIDIMERRGFRIVNIDAIVKAEEPMISPYRGAIKENIARICKIEEEKVNVKGKKGEGFGYVGEKRAVEAYAVVLVEEMEDGKGKICTEPNR